MGQSLLHIELVQDSIDYIETHLREDISVQSIGERIPMSNWQFQRVFRALVGDSIGSYLRRRRLTLALEDLKSEKRIIDIAIDFQFGSQEAFTRAFKTAFQMTPMQYRKNKPQIVPQKKVKITHQVLDHLQTRMTFQPKIIDLPEISLLGLETNIINPLAKDTDYAKVVPQIWQEFNPLKKQISQRLNKKSYGVALENNSQMESMTYFVGVEIGVKDPTDSAPFKSLILEPGKYAVFTHRGTELKTQDTMNYIYGTWLPQSGYSRGTRPEFEIFDFRFNINDDEKSLSDYYLPVETG